MTIFEYIKQHGSTEKAAHALGVTLATMYRWKNSKTVPRGLYADLLKQKGIIL